MIRPILRMGNPLLLRVAKSVEDMGAPEVRTIIADMYHTMHAANGVGLAAPQIGVDLPLMISVSTKIHGIPMKNLSPS